jgi:amino acid adenylation domain-containing protein
VTGPRPADTLDVLGALRVSASQVIDATGSATMAEVCDRSARLARVLAEQGVAAETTVGLCVGRGIGMLSGMLAVWWAGGAYVPLDPDLPEARLTAMVEGAGVGLIVSDDEHAKAARQLAGDRVVLLIDGLDLDAIQPLDPVTAPDEALAYTIFTSGSTGRPKGVAVSRGAVANLLAAFRRTPGLTARDRFVAVTTLSFDIALLELLLPPLCGADLVIASAAEAREPDRLRALIDRTAASAMQATPQTWRLLESAGGVPDTLRLRWCGGEALPRDLADRLAAPGAELWNLYGPTETTVWSAAGRVSDEGLVTIGPPIDHTAVYLLDERLQPVPDGAVGEVCIGGRGLARGYHGEPRLTARAFRPDPYSGEPGARLYRTGDLGRRRGDGRLELLGRADQQIKLRGFRIECGEIEAALRNHSAVRQAAVVLDTSGSEPELVAYVVWRRRGSPTAADQLALLRPHLRKTLPDYMLPDLFVPLAALPMTPNAKVDRAALPAPDRGVRSSAEHVKPRTPVEEALARVWSDLLAHPVPVGVHDNLFALGGHSLTATRFVARVGDMYGVTLPVHRIFATPTIAELAEAVAADPDFAAPQDTRDRELDALSDADLDDLLRAALAQRERRRAAVAGSTGPAGDATASPIPENLP